MKLRFLYLTWLSAAVVAFSLPACSATGRGNGFGEGGAGGEASSTGTGMGGMGTFVGSGGGGPFGSGCSADLRSVVDGSGNVIIACPPEEGCSAGQCVPACEAAAKSKGSIGCEYWAPDPPFVLNGPNAGTYAGTCYAVFIANTWSRPAKITVERGGTKFDATQFGRIPKGVGASTTYEPLPPDGLPPSEVAVLFLSHQPGAQQGNGDSLECPIPPAVLADAAIQGSGKGSAFRISVDTPITAYDILPYGGAKSYLPSASLLAPATAWGTNYFAVSPHPSDDIGLLWALVVGAENGTTLKVLPSTTLPGGGGLPTAQAGQTNEFTINAGEMLQWIGADPTGAVLQSDKPVGLWAGSTYLKVQTTTSPFGGGQDSAHQEVPPISALGNEYVGAGIMTRTETLAPESIPYRFLGVIDGTMLAWDPAPPPGAPTALAAGQVAEFETTSLFSVRSQDKDTPS